METYLLSVIVPAYNAEKKLARCIDSLLKQEHIALQIIIVNDGSADNTRQIAEKYGNRYARVYVLNQENLGTFRARLNGIRLAEAEYITFCDADDFIDQNFYSRAMKLMVNKQADVVEYGYRRIVAGERTKEKLPAEYRLNGKEAVKILLETRIIESYNCNKIYKAEILHAIRIPDGIRMSVEEDRFLNILAFDRADCVTSIPIVGYNYEQDENSSSSVSVRDSGLRTVEAQRFIFNYICLHLPAYEKPAAYDFCARLALSYLYLLKNKRQDETRNIIREFYNLCKQYHINRYFPKNGSLKRILMIQVVYWLASVIK